MAVKYTFKKTSHTFYEKQHIRNWPVFSLLLALESVLIYFVLQDVMTDNLWGAKRMQSWTVIVFTALIPTPLLIGYLIVRLDTFISEEGIFYRWVPFSKSYKMFMWDNIREIALIDIKKSGGRWHVSKGFNEVTFPGGKFGIAITTKSGRKHLISSRKAEELNTILNRLGGAKYQSKQAEGLFTYD